MRLCTLILLMILLTSAATAQLVENQPEVNPWGQFLVPLEGTPQVYGTYRFGCVVGAETMEERGLGFETVNRKRVRFFGHPNLFVAMLDWAAFVDEKFKSKLIFGDVSQPVGGPAGGGHASHQVGLDADIRLFLLGADTTNPDPNENLETPFMVKYSELPPANAGGAKQYTVEFLESNWQPEMNRVLEYAATTTTIERIFVNPPIKKFLCKTFASKDPNKPIGKNTVTDIDKLMESKKKADSVFVFPAWLRKIRPESGHVYHFHVRMACPTDSPDCKPQTDIVDDNTDSTGVGCSGDTFNSWFTKQALKNEYFNPEANPLAPPSVPDPNAKPEVPYWKQVITSKSFPEACTRLTQTEEKPAE